MIHDKTGRLVEAAVQRVATHLRKHKAKLACCDTPKWSAHGILSGWPILTSQQDRSVLDSSRGTPVITIACTSCGQTRNYLASAIFSEWLKENAVEDPPNEPGTATDNAAAQSPQQPPR